MNDTNVILEVKNLKKTFGDHVVLKDINTTITKGEVIAIIGPSGCGKSTFLRSLNLLEVPTSGHIIYEGNDLTEKGVNVDKLRQSIGMVFQHFNLFPNMTIKKNITLAPTQLGLMSKEDADKKALELLERVGLLDKADSYPDMLSGGQKQRVAIAGIIAMRPDCIVLDEPTAMLDPSGRREVMNTIHMLNREYGITIVLITHYMEEAAQADRVIVMDDGNILLDDRPEEVFSHVEQMKAIGLDVPQVTELVYELRQQGIPLDSHIISEDAGVEAILQNMA